MRDLTTVAERCQELHGYDSPKRCPWCKHDVPTDPIVPATGPDDWEQSAKHALYELAHSGRPFTSEDLTAMVGFPGTSTANGNNKVGLFIQRQARTFRLRRVDMVAARNPQSHGRLLTAWMGRS